MPISRFTLCVAAGLFCCTPSVLALNADSLAQSVVQSNAGLSATRSAVAAARALIGPAGALEDPTLSLGIAPDTFTGLDQPDGGRRNINVKVDFSQNLPWPGKLALRERVQRRIAEATQDDADLLQLQLASLARAAWADWAWVHRALEINQSSQRLVSELRSVAESRYASGIAQQQDVLQAAVQLQHLKHQAIQLDSARRTVRARINGLLNQTANTPLSAPAPLPNPEPVLSYARLSGIALARHPELSKLDHQIAASADREALARKNFYPDFKLFAGYNSLWDLHDKRWVVGAGINLPLAQQKFQDRLNSAQANSLRMTYELADRRAQLLADIESARISAVESAHVISLYTDRLIPLSQENLNAARSNYGAGGGAFLDVITAERQLLKARLELANQKAKYVKARAQLSLATGGKLPAATEPESANENS